MNCSACVCVDIMCSTSDVIRVNREDKPAPIVKSQIMKLDYSHMEYIMNCFHDQTSDFATSGHTC